MQKRVLAVYFSIIRRSAICAVAVMASASSSMMSLNVARGDESAAGAEEKICLVLEKVLICSLVCVRHHEDHRYSFSLPNDVNASIIRRIELKNHLTHVLVPVYPSRES